MTGQLRTDEQIRAAGAKAVANFPAMTDRKVDQIAALLNPVRDEVWRPLDQADATTRAA